MATLLLDLRFALRSLRRRPTFAVVAVATIGLSIGAATSLFSIVDAVLFRPLPYRDPGELVSVWQTDTNWKKQPIVAAMWDRMPIDYTDFLTWRARQSSFSGVAVWANRTMMLDGVDGPEQRPGVR